MRTISCILVDDEALALDLLEEYVQQTPHLQLAGRFPNATAALERLDEGGVDLMFLDIQMPRLRGTDFLKSLFQPPVTIFTTAYQQYAPEAFDLDAVDYLIKPFPYDRFLKAVNKAHELIHFRQGTPANADAESSRLIIKADGRLVKIRFDEIIFIEGWKEYVRIYTAQERFVTLDSLKNLEATLPTPDFIRIHKSYIVALKEIRFIEGNQAGLQDRKLPIGRTLKDRVLQVWSDT
ncbi:MAG: LytTR family DNA-binding domain-containing protein [Bacteroidota bacterium]